MTRPPLRVWVWTAAVIALAVVAALLWAGSDAAATESTTAAPAGVPDGTPAGTVSAAWDAPTSTTGPRPAVHAGRVVVAGEHGVRALDVETGDEAWRYTRANAVLCDWTLVGSLVVAVFRTEDRCDEALALAADTGVRAWTRNVDLRSDMTLSSTDGIVLAAAPTGIVTIDPVGDAIRWRQAAPEGCRLDGADVGAAGVVVLQRCRGTDAPQLRLFDGYGGSALWTRDVLDDSAVLADVDRAVTVAGDAGVQLFAGADGAPLGTPALSAGEDPVLVTGVGDTALVLADGELGALDQTSGTVRWQVPATGLPTGPADAKTLATGTTVPVAEGDAVVLRDLGTGVEQSRSRAPELPPDALVTVAGPVVVLQLPDRVVAHR
ncbi:PQQ-binding-like beta-propeller repeat protein [Geodermatophilus sabuli]|uniref:PQQ-binding-like beta-propeller repeat protein n=1 Tax=Geodermatophilus sabuli TaxID=1564158 RepID=A0A7K3VY30_9ACTN|nr:PQQ-binding-like beta-propeller repeat protein [Geodermatophilus sabuli]